MADRNETLADIAADIRERAENVKRHGDERPTSGEAIGNLLLSIADRIEEAAKEGADHADAAWNRRAPVMRGCRYSDGAGGCRTSPLVPPSETPCEHADNPSRCRLYRAKGGQ